MTAGRRDPVQTNFAPEQLAADVATVSHIDRRLAGLPCLPPCPSSVHYMHLVNKPGKLLDFGGFTALEPGDTATRYGAADSRLPVFHTAEPRDWVTVGAKPRVIESVTERA